MITQKKWITHVIILAVVLMLLDFITTYIFTPDLKHEGNIIFLKYNRDGVLNGYRGWVFLILLNILGISLFILEFIFFQKFYKSVLAQKENILSLRYGMPFLKDMFHLRFKHAWIRGKPLLIIYICVCVFCAACLQIFYRIKAVLNNTIIIVMCDDTKLGECKDVFILSQDAFMISKYIDSQKGFIIFHSIFIIVFGFLYYKDKKGLGIQNSLDTYEVSSSDIIYASILLIFSWNFAYLFMVLGDYFNH